MTDKEKLIQDTLQFCSKDAMNIEGLDREAIEELVEKGVITMPEDVMALHLDLVMKPGPYEKFKTSNIPIIYESVERAKKEAKPANILMALCIPGVTLEIAKKLVDHFGSAFYAVAVDYFKLKEVVGCDVAYEIVEWYMNEDNQNVTLWHLRNHGIDLSKEDAEYVARRNERIRTLEP